MSSLAWRTMATGKKWTRDEPGFFRDSIAQFSRNKNNYSERFIKKIGWFLEQRSRLATLLCPASSSPNLAVVMITLYPNFASFFMEDFPCVSLTHFRLDYESKRCWPYSFLET